MRVLLLAALVFVSLAGCASGDNEASHSSTSFTIVTEYREEHTSEGARKFGLAEGAPASDGSLWVSLRRGTDESPPNPSASGRQVGLLANQELRLPLDSDRQDFILQLGSQGRAQFSISNPSGIMMLIRVHGGDAGTIQNCDRIYTGFGAPPLREPASPPRTITVPFGIDCDFDGS